LETNLKPEEPQDLGPGMQDCEDFGALFEQSMKTVREGDVFQGEIVQITKEHALIDIGYKSEGLVPLHEFADTEGQVKAKVGDQVEVLLLRKEDDDHLVLSKKKAAESKIWDEIQTTYQDNGSIKGTITSRIKGGLAVDIGVQAFLPGSHADLRPIKDMDVLIGTENEFKIIKFDKRHRNVVLSRRAFFEEERKAKREETLATIQDGTVYEGMITNVTNFGIFVDIGGLDGLVHITDLSWGRVKHPSDLYQIGDTVSVKVLRFDREKEKVTLGIKQLTPDPWEEAGKRYQPGTVVTCKVLALTHYGAFVELEEGVEGMIHVSEMSWTQKLKHPSQLLNVGDTVDAMVLKLDADKKRISLGIKQTEENPWDSIEERYPVGSIIEGKIKNMTDFGIFIGIDDGIVGLVHISDLSWSKRPKAPNTFYKKGETVQAVILKIDKENERFSLGIKQLGTDPWDEAPAKYRMGTIIDGVITDVTDFGLFVEIEEGIEGLVHLSQIPKEDDKSPLEKYHQGDSVQAKIIYMDPKERKLSLSLKLDETPDNVIMHNYMYNPKEATSNLGELLEAELKQKEKKLEEEA
jgi:small subunit ribosomal protein S1